MKLSGALERQFGPAWRKAAPLSEDEVRTFEADHGVDLPEPYRSFIRSEANGAAGPPFYGLVGLGQPSDTTATHAVTSGSLRVPFPLTDPWLWEDEAEPDEDRIETVHRMGALPLGTDGDGMDYVLIVTGAARGQVWMLTGEFALPVANDFGVWVEGDLLPDAVWTLQNRLDEARSV